MSDSSEVEPTDSGTAGASGAPPDAHRRRSDRLPGQIKFIVGNEGCERFSFYGMRSILTVFMTGHLMLPAAHAKAVYHLFVSACYLMPLLGAVIADRWWGRYKTILYISLFYCLGHGTLAAYETEYGLYVGLVLIAFGSGGIKPCVSAMVGDQFTADNKHLVQRVYNLFYWIINFGSFFSTVLIPLILRYVSASLAFGIPGILMGIATVVFWSGRNLYTKVPPTGGDTHSFTRVVFSAWRNRSRRTGQHWLDGALADHPADRVEGAKAVLRVVKIFAAVSVFWALFDQHGSSWVLQAQKMDLVAFGIPFAPSQIAAWNPLMVMTLIPLFQYGLYPLVERSGFQLTPLRRMTIGMFFTASSFVAVGAIEFVLDSGLRLNVMWQVVPYLLITMSEVLVSITGLEFAYTQAPPSMKSTIMSFWMLTVFVGNVITAYISEINIFEGPMFFFFFAALMIVAATLFGLLARGYKTVDYFTE